ncbi:IMPACT family protein [Fodinibius salsisoli]|uniref:YigZ family protein n=1 Tax=Fodinibius salsisoli TaxID=2820877 RepID=A0ABT3PSP2_9BACT|nr:YigZ family protein [Fodinibius salsisoli]
MQTLSSTYSHTFREKGSKFIGYLFPVSSKKNFQKELQSIISEYPDATHHCYGWRINPHKIEEFAQDDGEPSGTAGLPILNELKSHELVNCGCIVVRYYGGTKLGKSGLIQAYGKSARLCLHQASFSALVLTQNFRITYDYSTQSEIDQLKNTFDLKELSAEYLEKVTLVMGCRIEQAPSFHHALEQRQHLGIETEKLERGFVTL